MGDFNGGTISGNTASGNGNNGLRVDTFTGGNSAVFSNNSSTNNTLQGYDILIGTPFDGIMTNTGLAIFPSVEPKMFLPDGCPYTEWQSAEVR